MKFKKLKLAAAAAVLAVSGAASANIDVGGTGNGDLFFSIWDGANSYTRDLGITLDGFQAAVSGTGLLSFNIAADALFTTYLSTANLSNIVWNIAAADVVGARRAIHTYSTLPGTTIQAGNNRSAAAQVQAFAGRVNAEALTASGGDSAVFAAGTPAYAGSNAYGANLLNLLNFNTTGTTANSSYDTGLNLLRIDGAASGLALTTYTQYFDEGSAVRAYLQGGNLSIAVAAVPEPETYAMLLAGLGLMGAIARRRRNRKDQA